MANTPTKVPPLQQPTSAGHIPSNSLAGTQLPTADSAFRRYPRPTPRVAAPPLPKPKTHPPTSPAVRGAPNGPQYPLPKPKPPAPVARLNQVPTQPRYLQPFGLGGPLTPNLPSVIDSPSGRRESALNLPYINKPQWRQRLRQASFKGQPFYVEQQGRSSGRRTVTHQYPKRDLPYAEDMGREALHYAMTGYLLMAPNYTNSSFYGGGGAIEGTRMRSNYDEARDNLEEALLSGGPGRLIDPYNPRLFGSGYGLNSLPLQFMCEKYTITEARERGGYCVIEMSFVEYGQPGMQLSVFVNTVEDVKTKANNATSANGSWLDNLQTLLQTPGTPLTVEEMRDKLQKLGVPAM
jgi:hypothetical protein